MMTWELLNAKVQPEDLGLLPTFVSDKDERSAVQQFDANYRWGGWRPFKGFTLKEDNSLEYPDDSPLKPWAQARLRDELIVVYQHAWVAVIQPDRSFEVSRVD